MRYLVSDFFQLILKVLFKLTLNIIYKNLKILEIFSEEDFKL